MTDLIARLRKLEYRYLNEAHGEPTGEAIRAARCRIEALEAQLAAIREPSEEMVERVARAICLSDGDEPDRKMYPWGNTAWTACVEVARSALAAIAQ